MRLFPDFLWRKLVIPLVIIAIIFLILAVFIPWRGLFTNLATTFLGILITICYVDFILREHETRRWAQAMTLIKKRIDTFANVCSSQFRTAFKISFNIFDEEALDQALDIDNPSGIRREMIRVTENIIMPSVVAGVHKLTQEDWIKLVRQLQLTYERGDRLCLAYGNRINPECFSLIMKVQDEINSILGLYSILPDVIGVPDDDLPLKKTGSAKADKRAMEKIISSKIKNILESAVSLLRKLDE